MAKALKFNCLPNFLASTVYLPRPLTASDSITVGSGDETTVISGNSVTTGSVTAGNTTVNSDGLTIKDGPVGNERWN